jgi:hypothetical protein
MKNIKADWEKELSEKHFSMWSNWDRRMSHISKREKRLIDFIRSQIEQAELRGYEKGAMEQMMVDSRYLIITPHTWDQDNLRLEEEREKAETRGFEKGLKYAKKK